MNVGDFAAGVFFGSSAGGEAGGLDTSEFVKKTDYASNESAGVIKLTESATACGLSVNENGEMRIYRAPTSLINAGQNLYCPLTPASIPVFMEGYGITSKEMIPVMQEQINGLKIKKVTISQQMIATTRIIRLTGFLQSDCIILAAATNTLTSSGNRITIHPIYDINDKWSLRCDPTYGTISTEEPLEIDIFYIDMPVFDDGVSSGNSVLAGQSEAELKTESEDETS